MKVGETVKIQMAGMPGAKSDAPTYVDGKVIADQGDHWEIEIATPVGDATIMRMPKSE